MRDNVQSQVSQDVIPIARQYVVSAFVIEPVKPLCSPGPARDLLIVYFIVGGQFHLIWNGADLSAYYVVFSGVIISISR